MRGFGKSLAAAVTVLAVGAGLAWAQGEWKAPADWTSAKLAKETDGELFWKISNGRGPMPPWKHLPDQERWELVNYIRTLQKK